MATLRDIRMRIKGVSNTSKITSAMKMVSAAKLKRAQNAIESARPYVKKLDEVLSKLVASIGDNYTNPVTTPHKEIKNIAVIVIGSDRGLCGGFNSQLIKGFKELKRDLLSKYSSANIDLITVGKRPTQSFVKTTNENVVNSYQGIFQELNFNNATDIVADVEIKFINGQYNLVLVYHNEFVNIIKQVPVLKQLLPVQATAASESDKFNTEYIFEPNAKEILDELLPKLLNIKVWSALLDSSAAEQAARMMAMDTATSNAKDLITALNLVYNSKRQAAITTEMLEIVGGAEALSKK